MYLICFNLLAFINWNDQHHFEKTIYSWYHFESDDVNPKTPKPLANENLIYINYLRPLMRLILLDNYYICKWKALIES